MSFTPTLELAERAFSFFAVTNLGFSMRIAGNLHRRFQVPTQGAVMRNLLLCHSLFCVPSSARQWARARLAELFRAMVTKFDIKWVPQVHIRYRAKKYLAETKFRMADRITLWWIKFRELIIKN